MLGDFVFQVIDLVNKHLFLLLLFAFVVVYTLFEGELRLREPGQSIWILLHIAVKVLQVEVGLPSGHLVEDRLKVPQIQGHYTSENIGEVRNFHKSIETWQTYQVGRGQQTTSMQMTTLYS